MTWPHRMMWALSMTWHLWQLGALAWRCGNLALQRGEVAYRRATWRSSPSHDSVCCGWGKVTAPEGATHRSGYDRPLPDLNFRYAINTIGFCNVREEKWGLREFEPQISWGPKSLAINST
jgi:hypothetical protein